LAHACDAVVVARPAAERDDNVEIRRIMLMNRSPLNTVLEPDAAESPTGYERQAVQGVRPGDRYVRVLRPPHVERLAGGPGLFVRRPRESDHGVMHRVRRLLIGRPIATEHEHEERLTKVKALAVFSSDALSSVAYATEEIMKIAVLGGVAALSYTLPISLVIVALLIIVVASYRQTIRAYPSGGGSYIVASSNLGPLPGLTAAAALLIDYVLTVSVSIAAGVLALTSLSPGLRPYVVELAVGAVILITIANLRGIRESGSIFAIPTYAFVLLMYGLIAWGLFRLGHGGMQYTPPASALQPGARSVGIFLLLAAFAQGCTAMTGTEAISNGVPAFKKPEAANARITLVAMGALLGTMFIGLSFLAQHLGIRPADESVLSQVGRTVFGKGPIWVALQIATALILILAANTAFADFPRLASILAKDRYLPRAFQFRGDRLAFTMGIGTLAFLSATLLVIFKGSIDGLIPLYAVGVFTSFTLSQAGMVVHWRNVRGPGWRKSAIVNGIGMVATGIVTIVIAATKFLHGAWLVVVLIPLFILLLRAIHNHYVHLEASRRAETPLKPQEIVVRAIVPIADLGVQAKQAVAYASAVTKDNAHVVAVHVTDDLDAAEAMWRGWDAWAPGPHLEIVESPFRSLMGPLLAYVDEIKADYPHDTITVVLPEFVSSHWWEQLLHNQTSLRIKAALLFHPGIVVTNVPYHLGR
jgi:amino acid transporter